MARRTILTTRHESTPTRPAFTLIELAVVLAIILILAALVAGVVARVLGTQEVALTETGIRKVDSILHARWDAVLAQADRDNIESSPNAAAVATLAGKDPDATRRLRVLYRKAKLKQEFPVSFGEAISPPPMGAKDAYVNYLKFYGITSSNASAVFNSDVQSAACLLMALTKGGAGSAPSAEEFGGGNIKYASDPNLSGSPPIPYLGDAWGNPLVFFRWPTGNAELRALEPPPPVNLQFVSVPPSTCHDPQDPEGLLLNPAWYAAYGQSFEWFYHPLHNAAAAPAAFYTVPIIVSPGPDGLLGMNADGSIQASGATDNVFSFRLQKQGARGN